MTTEPEFVTITEAAHLLGVSRTTVVKRIKRGKLTEHQFGPHAKLIRTDDLLSHSIS